MTKTQIQANAAQAEIDRRIANRTLTTPVYSTLPEARLGGKVLAAMAAKAKVENTPKAPKAPAVKVTPAKVVDPHTALRTAAWAWRNEEFHAGRKVTVDAAYAKFGTHRASK